MSMDDVLPLFLYAVVRARIRHFGAEVKFMEDFLQLDRLSGESRVLLTTMRAAYVQLQLESADVGVAEEKIFSLPLTPTQARRQKDV